MNEVKRTRVSIKDGRDITFVGELLAETTYRVGSFDLRKLQIYKTLGGKYVGARTVIKQRVNGDDYTETEAIIHERAEHLIDFFGYSDDSKQFYQAAGMPHILDVETDALFTDKEAE